LANNAKFLNQAVGDIFSLLPTTEAISSSREVVERYLRNDTSISSSIKWAEFELNGRFVRGGTSRVGAMSSHLVSNWGEDEQIAEIVNHAREHGLKAGQFIPATAIDGNYWCVPYSPGDRQETPSTRLRTILLTEPLFMEIVDLFNSDANLSLSEKRIVFQVVNGLNPGQAAQADNVSIETKRSQLKKASAKLFCAGQTELVRLMLGQMVHILYLCDVETSHIQITEQFSSEVFGDQVKLSVQRLPNGRLMRYWEMGPASGKPVLLIHGYLFPFLLLNARQQLEKLNLRLIIPIRGGYLDDQARSEDFHEGNLVEQTLEDLIQFTQLYWDGPAPVLGYATGGFYALMMVKRQQDLFSKIMVISLNIIPTENKSDSFSSRFWGGLGKLAKDRKIFVVLTRQFLKTTFSNNRTTKFVLRRLFKDCATDLGVLNGEIGSGEAFGWFRKLLAGSVLGISSDFSLVAHIEYDYLDDISTPMVFFHGPEDVFTKAAEISDMTANNPLAKLVVLPKGGHLTSASHPEDFWQEVLNTIDQ